MRYWWLWCRTMKLFFPANGWRDFCKSNVVARFVGISHVNVDFTGRLLVPRGCGGVETVLGLAVGSLEVGHTPFLALRTHGHLLPLWWRHVSGDPPRGTTLKTVFRLCTRWKPHTLWFLRRQTPEFYANSITRVLIIFKKEKGSTCAFASQKNASLTVKTIVQTTDGKLYLLAVRRYFNPLLKLQNCVKN